MPGPVTLDQIFGAFVSQSTLEEAAAWMAALSQTHSELHDEFLSALRSGCEEGGAGPAAVVHAVNQSGYRAGDVEEARRYCSELMTLYEARRAAL